MFGSHELHALTEYAVGLLTAGLERTALAPVLVQRWEPYHRLLGDSGAADRPLTAIYADIGPGTTAAILPHVPLALTEGALFPRREASTNATDDWASAPVILQQVAAGIAGAPDPLAPYAFEPLYFTMQRYGTNLPATIAGGSLSLFRQFALVSALFAASGSEAPAASYTLVGSDTPGIQHFITASTASKGQAKGLRGRSLFLQLITDAVAQRLLDTLGLPRANLLYAAGGNLLLLAPHGVDDRLREARRAVSDALLVWSEGEIDQALAWVRLASERVGQDIQPDLRALRAELNVSKRRPYGDLLAGDPAVYAQLFALEQRPPRVEREVGDERNAVAEIDTYSDLADELRPRARQTLYLHRRRVALPAQASAWQRALHGIAGGWLYQVRAEGRASTAVGDSLIDAINDPTRVPAEATGFRFIGLTTPLDPDRSIRELSDIAEQTPMSRIGVLRMDVDSLGAIFGRELRPASLAAICTLSASLDRFFAGWLNVRCGDVERQRELSGAAPEARGDLLYTIYSGGDDLFIIGAWDRLPVLADAIRADFARYCGGNPALHLSAGIAIDTVRFPLYQLGERAAGALDDAKALRHPTEPWEKDALSLFGQVLPWRTYPAVRALVARLTATSAEPSALLGRLRDLALLDRAERARFGLPPADPYGSGVVMVGRAQWRGLVALQRAIEQGQSADQALAALLRDLRHLLLDGTLTPHLALVARWADYLWREPNRREEE